MTPTEAAIAVLDRYPTADSAVLAGSVMRGEATPSSDLDIVVLFEHLDRAFRESFFKASWPVEVFAHDLETLEFFFQTDREDGVGSLIWMVHEGEPIPAPTRLITAAKDRASELIHEGPARWDGAALAQSRYSLTNLIDDLVDARSAAERRATLVALHDTLAEHLLRRGGTWSAKGKAIPRRLAALDRALASDFDRAFDQAFEGTTDDLLNFLDEILDADGGRLFDGYRSFANASDRVRPD